MKIPPPAINDMASQSVLYDVPYVPMQNKNDCWLAVLNMMHRFLVQANPKYELELGETDSQEQNGADDEQLDRLMEANGFFLLKEGNVVLKTASELSATLRLRGPVVTRIRVDDLMRHAVIVAGVRADNIYVMNPACNFVSSTLREVATFKERKKALKKELKEQGEPVQGFKDWKGAQRGLGRAQGGGSSSLQGSPELGRRQPVSSGQLSPPRSPRQVLAPSKGSQKDEEDEGPRLDDPFAMLAQMLKKSPIGDLDRAIKVEDQYLKEMQAPLHKCRLMRFEQFTQKLPDVARVWVAGD